MLYKNISNNPIERHITTYPYVFLESAFSDQEIDITMEYCESQKLRRGLVSNDKENEKIRKSNINFHTKNEHTEWIFEKLNSIITNLNNNFYGFDVNGYNSFQYTTYEAQESGHYDWHMDTHMGPRLENIVYETLQPRKLSLTLLLNDPIKDFDGGEFEINRGSPEKINFTKGMLILFPSFILHKVNPVTRGTRKSLVTWVTGPKFS